MPTVYLGYDGVFLVFLCLYWVNLENQGERYLLCWDSIITSYPHTLGTCSAFCFLLREHLGIQWTLHLRSCSSLLCKLGSDHQITAWSCDGYVWISRGHRILKATCILGSEESQEMNGKGSYVWILQIFPKYFYLNSVFFKTKLGKGYRSYFFFFTLLIYSFVYYLFYMCLNVCLHITYMHIRPLRQCGKQLWATL